MTRRPLPGAGRVAAVVLSVAVHWVDATVRTAAALALGFLVGDVWLAPPGPAAVDPRERLLLVAWVAAALGAWRVATRAWRERRPPAEGPTPGPAAPTRTAA